MTAEIELFPGMSYRWILATFLQWIYVIAWSSIVIQNRTLVSIIPDSCKSSKCSAKNARQGPACIWFLRRTNSFQPFCQKIKEFFVLSIHEERKRSFNKFWLLWLSWSLLKPLPTALCECLFISTTNCFLLSLTMDRFFQCQFKAHFFGWNWKQILPHIAMHFLLHFMVAIYFGRCLDSDLIDKFNGFLSLSIENIRSNLVGISWVSGKIIDTETEEMKTTLMTCFWCIYHGGVYGER